MLPGSGCNAAMLDTPVLFLIFNRPKETAASFTTIRQQKPRKLYLVADGPRNNRQDDKLNCALARKTVLDAIDWDCDLHTLLRDENLGCGPSVADGITWFFKNEEYGIILEDDCVPDDTFFTFCTELLKKYFDETKVMMISGCSFQPYANDSYSYYFSNYIHVWGWATWRRAWDLYNFKSPDFDPVRVDRELKKVFKKQREREIWVRNTNNAMKGIINTWDYQWMYAIWKNRGLSVVPWKNMVSNIGYGEDATHTIGYDANTLALPAHALATVLHPQKIEPNKKADRYIRFKLIINKHNLIILIKRGCRKLLTYVKGNV